MPGLLEEDDFHQRRPELDGSFDHADDVVDDAHEVLLKEIRLEAAEGLMEVGGEQPQGVGAFRSRGSGDGAERAYEGL